MRAYHIVPFYLSTIHLHLLFRSPVDLPIFLPAKSTSRFLLSILGRFLFPISSHQIDELISIADFFPPNRRVLTQAHP